MHTQGTLRVLLVLLHDFPELLCEYHFGLCDCVPPSCIQMRNLLLSAFPRAMRLPDPFTLGLKVTPSAPPPWRLLLHVVYCSVLGQVDWASCQCPSCCSCTGHCSSGTRGSPVADELRLELAKECL